MRRHRRPDRSIVRGGDRIKWAPSTCTPFGAYALHAKVSVGDSNGIVAQQQLSRTRRARAYTDRIRASPARATLLRPVC